MSLVGPSSSPVEYLPLYTSEQTRGHEVRPAITGLAQISGRNALSWKDGSAIHAQYVDSRSLAVDARILLLTVMPAFRRDGMGGAEGTVTVGHSWGSLAAPGARH